MNAAARTFEDRPAVREKTPILIGLVGPSGGGKTYSALRLATGMQRVTGGEIFGIDTEANRMLHYADRFKFRHIEFKAPFGPLDYLASVEHCVRRGATTIIIDSMSHEHEGAGGVLEQHEKELERLAGDDYAKRDRVKMLAWAKPKAARRRLINSLLQVNCNFLFCFRAKEKLKIERGKEPEPLGFMPIAGDEFVYEMTMKSLLLPGANGVPTVTPAFIGEKAMVKIPEQFRALMEKPQQLSEDIGQQLATWAAGAASSSAAEKKSLPTTEMIAIVEAYEKCQDAEQLRELEAARKASWSTLTKEDQARYKAAADEAAKRVAK